MLRNQNKQTKKTNKKERKLLGNQGVLLVAIFDYILDKYIIQDYLWRSELNPRLFTPSRIKEIRMKNPRER